MGAGHDHGVSAVSAGERHRWRLVWALLLVGGFFIIELIAALRTGSLALLSDAGHMLTDVLALSMALAAISAAAGARNRPHAQRSFGLYRLEILAALANAVLLLGVAGYVLVESLSRFRDPPHVAAGPMLAVGALALVVTLTAFALLRRGAKESLNLRGAAMEVGFDALSSAGVILAALVLLTTGWPYADPLVAAAIGVAIIPRALGLGRQALRVLVQAAPTHVSIPQVQATLAAVPGVCDVHDLHVWTLTSGMDVASAHLSIDSEQQLAEVLAQAQSVLRAQFGIVHATLQVEPTASCSPAGW